MGRIAGVTPEQTRERLLQAAADVFAADGYERATVAEIARRAGLSSGALYTHYRSKADLLVEAIRARRAPAVAALFPRLRGDLPGALLEVGRRLNRRDDPSRGLLAEALLAARRDPELAAVLSAAVIDSERRLVAALGDGQATGQIHDAVPAEVVARFSLMLGLGSLLVRSLDLPPVDSGEWSTFIRRLLEGFTTGHAP